MCRLEYQKKKKKTRGGNVINYCKGFFISLLLSGGLFVFNIEYIDIDVNFNFNKAEVTEIKITSNSI